MAQKTFELKELEYPNIAFGTSRVAYAMFPGNRCVFSGLNEDGTSSINGAETIVVCIARHEKINPLAYTFFDLQTHLMYGGGNYCPHPGEFEFDELKLKRNTCQGANLVENEDGETEILIGPSEPVIVEWWHKVPCPPVVIEAFAHLIGDQPKAPYQSRNPLDHDPQRSRMLF